MHQIKITPKLNTKNKFPGCVCSSCPSKILKFHKPVNGEYVFISYTAPDTNIKNFLLSCVHNLTGNISNVGFNSFILCNTLGQEKQIKEAAANCMGHLNINDVLKTYIVTDTQSVRIFTGTNMPAEGIINKLSGTWIRPNIFYIGDIKRDLYMNPMLWYKYKKRLHKVFRPNDFKFGNIWHNRVLRKDYSCLIRPRNVDEAIVTLSRMSGDVSFDVETSFDEDKLGLVIHPKFTIEGYTPGAEITKLVVTDKIYECTVISKEILYDSRFIEFLSVWFNEDNKLFISHNSKFDWQIIKKQLDVDVRVDFDTMLAHGALYENSKFEDDKFSKFSSEPNVHRLKTIVRDYFGVQYEAELLGVSKGRTQGLITERNFELYAAIDACMTLKLKEVLKELLEHEGLYERPFLFPLMYSNKMFCNMEYVGLELDEEFTKRLDIRLGLIYNNLVKVFQNESGILGINPNSPKQLQMLFYNKLKYRPIYSKTGSLTTDKSFIDVYKDEPLVKLLKAVRLASKMRSSYTQNMLKSVDIGGRIHPHFKVLGARSGRISVTDPAFQTLPKSSHNNDFAKTIRACVVSSPGKKLVVCDYSQLELRIAASLSNAQNLIEIYNEGKDIHKETAVFVYGEESYNDDVRKVSKIINFKKVYGGSVYTSLQLFNNDRRIAEEFEAKYNIMFKDFVEWKDSQFELTRQNLYVTTLLNRRRRIPFVTKDLEHSYRRMAGNHPIQGTANDLVLVAATRIYEAGYNVVLLVHDEIVVEVDEDKAQECAAFVKQTMEEVCYEFLPNIKWVADADEPRSRYKNEVDLSILDKYLVRTNIDLESFNIGLN